VLWSAARIAAFNFFVAGVRVRSLQAAAEKKMKAAILAALVRLQVFG
jgi:hypothetical protein